MGGLARAPCDEARGYPRGAAVGDLVRLITAVSMSSHTRSRGTRLAKRSQDLQLKRLREIKPFIQTLSQARAGARKDRAFLYCLRASLSKSFEFCLEAHQGRTNCIAFFLVPSLRSICEDLIVLSYMTKMPSADRNEIVLLLMEQELASGIDIQSKFFELARPDQRVIRRAAGDKTKIEDSIRQIWKRNGWAGLTSSWMPSTRQIAQKNQVDVLATLYDYIYRLTSGAVHFNPRVLFRTGWGKPILHFSTKNFDKYYGAYARTYGLFLFCCYFELFGRFLRPNKRIAGLVTELRFDLLSAFRWPEMITHEEMDLSLPESGDNILRVTYRYVDAQRRKRRILKAPDRATTLRQVKRLLGSFRRHPEKAKRVKLLVERFERKKALPR
jgi:hypothetical protein